MGAVLKGINKPIQAKCNNSYKLKIGDYQSFSKQQMPFISAPPEDNVCTFPDSDRTPARPSDFIGSQGLKNVIVQSKEQKQAFEPIIMSPDTIKNSNPKSRLHSEVVAVYMSRIGRVLMWWFIATIVISFVIAFLD